MSRTVAICLVTLLFAGAGCRQDMHDQPRYEPLEASAFFPDGRSARPTLPDTVARGQLRTDTHLYTGKVAGKPAETFPFPVTREVLLRGRERFEIFCSPCHDRAGTGQGVVVQRGFRSPPSFHVERLRNAPVGHFFDVISNGFGTMQGYAAQVPVRDRWAIAAYVRALQFSQHAPLDRLPADLRKQLDALSQGEGEAPQAGTGRTAAQESE